MTTEARDNMITVDEAREALAKRILRDVVGGVGSNQQLDLLDAADAYARASELKGHVDRCSTFEATFGEVAKMCGDGWYCPSAPRRGAKDANTTD